jgi:hypothetical protein
MAPVGASLTVNDLWLAKSLIREITDENVAGGVLSARMI